MASESGTETPPLAFDNLEEALRNEPHAFEFFQAVRLLRLLRPQQEGVGEFALPSDEAVRFTSNPSLAFPAGEVQDLRWEGEQSPRLEVNFMGLVGNQGVLPLHYSRLVLASERNGESSPLRAFLDLFQHRLLSLFYRALERGRFFVPFERGERDPVSARLLEMIGLGSRELRGRLDVPDEDLLFYAGLLGLHQRTAAALEGILRDYFEVPATVEEFSGGWYPLSVESQCCLDDEVDERSPRLGEHTVVGDEIWDPQARVRVKIGPLSRDRYEAFLPGGRDHRVLRSLTTFFSDGQFDFELQLILRKEDVPPVVLGAEEGEAMPLGWCTWIRTRPMDRDVDETTLTL
jgi:type VI secretion system protein ImpH